MSPGRAPDDALSEDSEEGVTYNLGFAEAVGRPTDLLRHRFPCKIGGRPAWLNPLHLPTRGQLTCPVTGQVLQFLLQIYCPIDSNPHDAFHRTVYLFVSPRGDKLATPGAVKVLRCQLPRSSPFYSDQPARDSDLFPKQLEAADHALALERDPWQVAAAEEEMRNNRLAVTSHPAAAAGGGSGGRCDGPVQFKEQELVVEPEPEDDEGEAEGEVQRIMAEYQARVAAEGEYDEAELPTSLVDELEEGQGEERRTFAAFQARTARAPEQCIRYSSQEGATPLWPSPRAQPGPQDIPPCPHCGQQRRFEFQVMPQLLSVMDLDAEDPTAPDWGTLVVYTCPSSCSGQGEEGEGWRSAYLEEFVWFQPS